MRMCGSAALIWLASLGAASVGFSTLCFLPALTLRERLIGGHGLCRFLSRRSIARKRIGPSLTSAANLGPTFVVLVMNWLHVGGEKGFCFSSIGMGTKLNRRQWDSVKRLAALVDGWNSQQFVSSDDMGRSASKVESIEIVLEELALKLMRLSQPLHPYSSGSAGFNLAEQSRYGHPGEVVGSLSAAVEHVAKDVEPSRLKFHEVLDAALALSALLILHVILLKLRRRFLRCSYVANLGDWLPFWKSWMNVTDFACCPLMRLGRACSADCFAYRRMPFGTGSLLMLVPLTVVKNPSNVGSRVWAPFSSFNIFS